MTTTDGKTRRHTLLAFGGLLLLAAVAYVGLFVLTKGAVMYGEQTFVSKAHANAPPLDVYVEVLGVDPVRQAMRLQIDVATGAGVHGARYFGRSTRDVDLRISDGNTERDVAIRRDAPMPATLFDAGLQGSIDGYPFDRYALRTVMSASERSADRGARDIPLRVTVWEGQPAWVLHAQSEAPFDRSAVAALAFDIRRPAPLLFFACAMYAVMVLVAVAAMLIAALVLVDSNRIEATLIGALAAMVFALPALRNILPGAPPLGVNADVLIFLWAEMAVVIGLALVVFAWVRRGASSKR